MPGDPAPRGSVPGVDPYIVHLVRDPRAVAFSWRRKRTFLGRGDDVLMPRYGWEYSGVSWTARNALAEIVKRRTPAARHLTLRYEDLVADPAGSLGLILGMLELGDAPLGFLHGRTARVRPNHSVAGNPSRMRTGCIHLESDDEWMERMGGRGWWAVTLLTAPLLRKYGYPIRRPVRSRACN